MADQDLTAEIERACQTPDNAATLNPVHAVAGQADTGDVKLSVSRVKGGVAGAPESVPSGHLHAAAPEPALPARCYLKSAAIVGSGIR